MQQRRRVRELRREGLKLREIVAELGCSRNTVMRVLHGLGKLESRQIVWSPGPIRLSLVEREEISLGLRDGDSLSVIAVRLGRATSSISREIARNGGRSHYRAVRAHHRAYGQARRPKTPKLVAGPLCAQVEFWLEEWWSPEEIARRLRVEFPDDPTMRVSHETIYQSLFVQGRGELRRELSRCLRSGRAQRRPKGRIAGRGQIQDMVMISERPGEAKDRAVPGHWEGDLIIGKNNASAVGTLVERSTRCVILLHLPDGREAEKVIDAGVQVYFCDPHSPWQRGSNENTNGLLRQYMPKGTDLSVHSAEDLARFAASLNNRPRETLGFMKPSEKLAELLAMTG